MKIFLLAPIFAIFLTKPGVSFVHPASPPDTAHVQHILDGMSSEWPAASFETDKDAGVSYAMDNDGDNLYVIMNVPNIRTQVKMMRQGMSLYVDVKDKKKKGKGVEFPVKKDDGSSGGFTGGNRGDQRGGFDPTAYRSMYALNMIKLKMFGFSDGDPFPQGLLENGSANIAFGWDSASGLHIEYKIPLSMLDDKPKSLDKKEISIGWKINGVDMPLTGGSVPSSAVSSTRGGGRPINLSTNGSSQAANQGDQSKAGEDQYIWTKFTVNIPAM